MIFSEFKSALELLAGLYKKAKDRSVKAELEQVREQLFTMHTSYLKLESDNLSLKDDILSLKDEIKALEAKQDVFDQFELEKSKYTFKEAAKQVFLYEHTRLKDDTVPAHYACPKCFANKKIAILQCPDPSEPELIQCLECKSEFRTKPGNGWGLMLI